MFSSAKEVRDYVSGNTIKCLECNKDFLALVRHISSMHGMSPAQYREKHGIPLDVPLSTKAVLKKASDAIKGVALERRIQEISEVNGLKTKGLALVRIDKKAPKLKVKLAGTSPINKFQDTLTAPASTDISNQKVFFKSIFKDALDELLHYKENHKENMERSKNTEILPDVDLSGPKRNQQSVIRNKIVRQEVKKLFYSGASAKKISKLLGIKKSVLSELKKEFFYGNFPSIED